MSGPADTARSAGAGNAAEPTYESASARVEEIIRRLDGGAAGLRETLDLVKEGRGLIEFCARELEAVSSGLEELRLEELVERLEVPAGPRSGTRATGQGTTPETAPGTGTGSATARGSGSA
jgi:exodeoxyribonuclease VII small subunit